MGAKARVAERRICAEQEALFQQWSVRKMGAMDTSARDKVVKEFQEDPQSVAIVQDTRQMYRSGAYIAIVVAIAIAYRARCTDLAR